jgi:hypothetical protein
VRLLHLVEEHGSDTEIVDTRADSEDSSSSGGMRRINVSPPRFRHSDSDSYSDDEETAEVEAALNVLDDELDETEDVLTEWSRAGPSTGISPSSYSSNLSPSAYTSPLSGSYSIASGTYSEPYTLSTAVDRSRILSTISERTENLSSSRPGSHAFPPSPVTLRPANPTPDALRRSANLGSPSLHSRSSTDPGIPLPPGRRAGDLIAFFEDKTVDVGGGHSRIASAPGGPRSPSPYLPQSQSAPGMVYGSGYGSRPSSPAKSRSSVSSSTSASHSITSLLSPPGLKALTSTSGDTRTYRPSSAGDYLSHSGLTGTFTNTFTGTPTNTFTATSPSDTFTATPTDTFTGTGTISALRRPQVSPRSPLSSVRNIVAAWKERTPTKVGGASESAMTSPTGTGDGLFSIRRRADRALSSETTGGGSGMDTPRSGSSGIPPPFDASELSHYAKGNHEVCFISFFGTYNVTFNYISRLSGP